jgi:hypothetical protein
MRSVWRANSQNLFLSHSWDHSDHREGLGNLISAQWGTDTWSDLSAPRSDPMHARDPRAPKRQLRDRIFQCDALIVFGGIYSSFSDWIGFETATAFAQYKPVIGVMPRGQTNCSAVVRDSASEIVGWTSQSVCTAILRHMNQSRRLALEPRLEPTRHLARLMAGYGNRPFTSNALLPRRPVTLTDLFN